MLLAGAHGAAVADSTRNASHSGCSSDAHCSYNGVCNTANGACGCDAQWVGAHCETLAVVAAARALGYAGRNGSGSLTSWGGAPLRGDDGTYHLILSEMTDNAGLAPWGTNSHVIWATSDAPLTKGFTKQGVLWGVFAHEPRCTRAPGTGEFVCYFSYNPEMAGYSGPCRGINGTTSKPNAPPGCGNDGGNKPTFMSWTRDPATGPAGWSTPVHVAGGPGLPDLNFAPVIFNNGSLFALFRTNMGNNIHVATAADWKDPSTYVLQAPASTGINLMLPEDPFVWLDPRTNVFHSLHHAYPWPAGPHAWSRDGWTWHVAPGVNPNGPDPGAYNRTVHFTDAPTVQAGCRERPSLLFAADGVTPLALLNGMAPNPGKVGAVPSGSCRYAGIDYCRTLLQPLNQEGG